MGVTDPQGVNDAKRFTARILAMFSDGRDTQDIADCLGVPEYEVWNTLTRLDFDEYDASERADALPSGAAR